MFKGLLLAFVLVVAGVSVHADSRETVQFSRAGPWYIMVDRTVANGCFVVGRFTAGTVVRVGWAPSIQKFYMMYGDDRWPKLDLNDTYTAKFNFDDGASTYTGTMKPIKVGTDTLLMHDNISTEFMVDFAKRGVLTVFGNNGERWARLSLESSQQAIDELLRCQKQMNG